MCIAIIIKSLFEAPKGKDINLSGSRFVAYTLATTEEVETSEPIIFHKVVACLKDDN